MTIRTCAIAALTFLSGCEFTELFVDVPSSRITGAFTLGGADFQVAQDQTGEVWLRGAGADEVSLGLTLDQQYDARVVDQTYDVVYSWLDGDEVPANTAATVLAGEVVAGDRDLPVDVGAAAVTATFTLEGAAFPVSAYDYANFYLQPVGTDELILLGPSHAGSGSALVVPGHYHVVYDYVQGSTCPINRQARLMEDLEVTGAQRLVLDVAAHSVRLTFTHNGSPFPLSQYDDATLHLRDQVTGAESFLMNTHAPVASALMLPGRYDVVYRHETGEEVPLNTAAIVTHDFAVSGDAALEQDIVSVSVDATVTLNGQPFEVSEYQDANLSIHDPMTGADTELGNTHYPFVDLVLIPGTYDVLYSHETGDAVPQNVRGLVAAGVTFDGAPLAIDVPGVVVEVDPTLDGAPFQVSQYDDANLYLVGEPSAEDILVGNTHDGHLSVLVLPGTYDLHYRHETGYDVPQNPNYKLISGLAVASDTALAPDIVSRQARLWATLDGAPFPDPSTGSARIFARSAPGDAVMLHETGVAPTPQRLIAGSYELVYEYTSGVDVPRNTRAVVGAANID